MEKKKRKAGIGFLAAVICLGILAGNPGMSRVVTAQAAEQPGSRHTGRSPTAEESGAGGEKADPGEKTESSTAEESELPTSEETESENETGTEPEQPPETEPETEMSLETELPPEMEPKPDPEEGTETESESENESENESETEILPETETTPETELETLPETPLTGEEKTAETEAKIETTTDTYVKNGGAYELPYILGTFNAFVSGDYYGTHVVGPMIVGGNTQLNGSLGGTTQQEGAYRHRAPSYLCKKAWNRDCEGHQSVPRIITGDPEMDVYLGMENAGQNVGNTKIGEDCRQILFTDEYLDEGLDGGFSREAFQKKLEAAGKPWMESGGNDGDGNGTVQTAITRTDLESAPEGTLTSGGAGGKGYRLYREGGAVKAELDAGGNYRFETFEGIDSIYYRYKDAEEMKNTITVIRTEQEGEVVLPKILKTVRDDVYGNNYGFDSIEEGPPFAVLYFAPNAERVFVGCEKSGEAEKTDTAFEWKPEQAVDIKSNGGKLVGHLWTPGADVVLRGGDYSGCVVADDVDASGSGAEGHMWPFSEPEEKPEEKPEEERSLTVQKRWQDVSGEVFAESGLPPVKIFLYRTVKEPEGFPVKLELYSGMHQHFEGAKKAAEIDLGYVGEKPAVFRAGCIDRVKGQPFSYSAGICETGFCVESAGEASLTVKKRGPEGALEGTSAWMDFELTAKAPCTIKVLLTHTAYNYSNGTAMPDAETLVAQPVGEGWNRVDFTNAGKVTDGQGNPVFLELGADNGWTGRFYDLPKKDPSGNTYFYKIAEEPVPDGFQVSYVNQINSGEGKAEVINRKRGQAELIELPETGGCTPELFLAAGTAFTGASAVLSGCGRGHAMRRKRRKNASGRWFRQ